MRCSHFWSMTSATKGLLVKNRRVTLSLQKIVTFHKDLYSLLEHVIVEFQMDVKGVFLQFLF